MERMKKELILATVTLFSLGLLRCGDSPTDPSGTTTAIADFSYGQHQWESGFADYPVGQEAFYELEAEYRNLPAPLDTSKKSLYISGNNHSDDLFMFWKGQIVGLLPNQTYLASFDVEFATRVPSGCTGVGGSPGESVYVKAGATEIEPEAVDIGGDYQMNIDKGSQSQGGEDAVVLGNVANSQECGRLPRWEQKQLSSGETVEVSSDGDGRVWVFIGTDSAFEATTSLYYTRIDVTFDPV